MALHQYLICLSLPFPSPGFDHRLTGWVVMTPREQLRKMTALGEQGALDEKHWYRLVNGMSAGGEIITIQMTLHILTDVALDNFSRRTIQESGC